MKAFLILLISIWIFSCTGRQSGGSGNSGTSQREGNDKPVYCAELVKEVLKSCDRYKQLTKGLQEEVKKNGGVSVDVVVDKSPDPKRDGALEYSSVYELKLTENYPDRKVSFAHFVFDPVKGELYEYDIVKDRRVSIPFDRQILEKSSQVCE